MNQCNFSRRSFLAGSLTALFFTRLPAQEIQQSNMQGAAPAVRVSGPEPFKVCVR